MLDEAFRILGSEDVKRLFGADTAWDVSRRCSLRYFNERLVDLAAPADGGRRAGDAALAGAAARPADAARPVRGAAAARSPSTRRSGSPAPSPSAPRAGERTVGQRVRPRAARRQGPLAPARGQRSDRGAGSADRDRTPAAPSVRPPSASSRRSSGSPRSRVTRGGGATCAAVHAGSRTAAGAPAAPRWSSSPAGATRSSVARHAGPAGAPVSAALRALRRTAGRTGVGVGHAAVRTGRPRRRPARARDDRRQGPAAAA